MKKLMLLYFLLLFLAAYASQGAISKDKKPVVKTDQTQAVATATNTSFV